MLIKCYLILVSVYVNHVLPYIYILVSVHVNHVLPYTSECVC